MLHKSMQNPQLPVYPVSISEKILSAISQGSYPTLPLMITLHHGPYSPHISSPSPIEAPQRRHRSAVLSGSCIMFHRQIFKFILQTIVSSFNWKGNN